MAEVQEIVDSLAFQVLYVTFRLGGPFTDASQVARLTTGKNVITEDEIRSREGYLTCVYER